MHFLFIRIVKGININLSRENNALCFNEVTINSCTIKITWCPNVVISYGVAGPFNKPTAFIYIKIFTSIILIIRK